MQSEKKSRAQKQRENSFEKKLEQLFDIAGKNSLKGLDRKNNIAFQLPMSSNLQENNNNISVEKHEEIMEIDAIGTYSLTIIQ